MSNKEIKLSENFLEEVLLASMQSYDFFTIVQGNLENKHLPDRHYQNVLKTIKKLRERMPSSYSISLGILEQEVSIYGKEENSIIEKVRESDYQSEGLLTKSLEAFIKRQKFIELHEDLKKEFNANNHEKAYSILSERASEISDFSLSDKDYTPLFGRFFDRIRERKLSDKKTVQKWPFVIQSLDRKVGGNAQGDTSLLIARSGVGKSKWLKSLGIKTARLGGVVVHFQAEGSKQECVDSYDSAIAGTSMTNMELGDVRESTIQELKKHWSEIMGEIYVISFEKFDTASLIDVRNILLDIRKKHGTINRILLDYLELFDPGDGKKYSTNTDGEKARRQALGRGFKNICLEFNVAGDTATQASDVPPQFWNDPDFFLTRSNTRGDKNLVDPFSYVFSLNQTIDEYRTGKMRLYEDKIRKFVAGDIHEFLNSYEVERFYDPHKTRQYHEHKLTKED